MLNQYFFSSGGVSKVCCSKLGNKKTQDRLNYLIILQILNADGDLKRGKKSQIQTHFILKLLRNSSLWSLLLALGVPC